MHTLFKLQGNLQMVHFPGRRRHQGNLVGLWKWHQKANVRQDFLRVREWVTKTS